MPSTSSSMRHARFPWNILPHAMADHVEAREPVDRAVIIGIVYHESKVFPDLTLPHSDALKVKKLLMGKYRFKEENIVILMDDGTHREPTRTNILQALGWLLKDAQCKDRFVFHYSGHGEQVQCKFPDPTEDDGMDEAIIPSDATSDPDTWIIDNTLNDMLVKKLPVGALLLAIFDMCHAGTALDLRHYECCNTWYEPFLRSFRRWTPDVRRYGAQARRGAIFRLPTPKPSDGSVEPGPSTPKPRRSSTSSSDLQCSFYVCERVSRKKIRTRHVDVDLGPPEAREGEVVRRLSISESIRTVRMEYETTISTSNGSASCDDREQSSSGFSMVSTSSLRQRTPRRKSSSADGSPRLSISHNPALSPVPETVTLPPSPQTSSVAIDYIPTIGCCIPMPFQVPFPALLRRLSAKVKKRKVQEGSILMARHSTDNARKVNRTVLKFRKPTGSSTQSESRSSTTPLLDQSQQSRPARSDTITSRAGVESPVCDSPVAMAAFEFGLRCQSPEPEPALGCPIDDFTTGQVISIAASADAQRAFEDSQGSSLTSVLVSILDKTDHDPTYSELMTELSLWLYESATEMHRWFRKRKLRQNAEGKKPKKPKTSSELKNEQAMDLMQDQVLNGEPIQKPILGSQRKFDLNRVRFLERE